MASHLRKILTIILLSLYCFGAAAAIPNFQNEKLSYVISYKWGIIQKDAAKATLTLTARPKTYEIKLAAATLPWADKIFCVRDTLQSWISRTTNLPIKYIKTTHENGRYNKDVLSYSYNGNSVTGTCNRTKVVNGKRKNSVYKATVKGVTYDMLSIFYYIRTLNFPAMTPGKTIRVNILSGSSPEILTINYRGTDTAQMPDGKNYKCYHIQFTFTTDKGTSVSAPMDTWITTDSRRIPVKLIGTLPIGKVRAFLTGVSA